MDKEYSVTINGEAVVFEFKDSLIHSEGEFEGNVDAVITTKPPLPQEQLLDELHIKIPGSDEFLYIYGYGVVENSLKATFNSSAHIDIKNIPDMVEVYWGANGEQFIGEMCCQKFSEEAESNIVIENEEDAEEEVSAIEPEKQNESLVDDKETNVNGFSKMWLVTGAVILLIICLLFLII